jgi:hypothetical protein
MFKIADAASVRIHVDLPAKGFAEIWANELEFALDK